MWKTRDTLMKIRDTKGKIHAKIGKINDRNDMDVTEAEDTKRQQEYREKIKRWKKSFGRKAMTNLDSILKSRDITLPTNIHLAKAMVFPVVMYGCESWTIKKAECRRTDAFKLWCWRRLLRIPWTARRSNRPF